MPLKDSYELFELQKEEAVEWLVQEVAGMRTGRVVPDMLSSIQVEHYGTRTPMQGLASISNVDARTLAISPWDPGSLTAIEKALAEADLGANPIVDGNIIRLSFAALTEEAREHTVKQLHKKGEEARVRLRQARDEALKMVKDEKDAGDLTEDDFYEGREQLDKLIDEANKEMDELLAKKEGDVRVI